MTEFKQQQNLKRKFYSALHSYQIIAAVPAIAEAIFHCEPGVTQIFIFWSKISRFHETSLLAASTDALFAMVWCKTDFVD